MECPTARKPRRDGRGPARSRPPQPVVWRVRFGLIIGATSMLGLPVLGVVAAATPAADWHALLVSPALGMAAGFVVLGEALPIASRTRANGATASTAFTFAILLQHGMAAAAVIQAVATLVAGVAWRHAWWRVGFNIAQHTLALAAAAQVLGTLGAAGHPRVPGVVDAPVLPAFTAAAAAYFVVNHTLVWGALACWRGHGPRSLVRGEGAYEAAANATLLGLSPLIAAVMLERPALVPLFVLPLAAVYRSSLTSRELAHRASHDPLTGLPNRMLLLERGSAACRSTSAAGGRVAVALLDLDRFKDVNNALGHPHGDRLLVMVAARLRAAARPQDLVARLGGDEFALLLPDVPDHATARRLAARAVRALGRPYPVGGDPLELEASVGVALCPDDAADIDALLSHADTAMYHAKRARCGIASYEPAQGEAAADRLTLLGDLRHALDTSQIDLHYQPKVGFSGNILGVEALLRWQHARRGRVSPEAFVTFAEETGLMHRLTAYVLDRALAQAGRWWHDGLCVPVAVNISVRDIHRPDLLPMVAAALSRYGLPPRALQLEITERILLDDGRQAVETLTGLTEFGVRLSLDDFGTGYSSLVHLRRIPVSELKIDRSFVARLAVDEQDAKIVRSAVDLAHSLDLHVVAEGVEDMLTWEHLRRLGCDSAQGRLVSMALPGQEATAWLRRHAALAPVP